MQMSELDLESVLHRTVDTVSNSIVGMNNFLCLCVIRPK